ncbi:hypothetical protein ACQ4PT_060165 [Festuca glaucescens]
MAPTLQDVSMLLGLPVSGRVVTPTANPNKDWCEHLVQRFRGVLPEDPEKPYEEFAHSYGIPFSWLCRFKLENMAANADDNQVARHLEAFLLWLFGWIMFTRSKGDIVDNSLPEKLSLPCVFSLPTSRKKVNRD